MYGVLPLELVIPLELIILMMETKKKRLLRLTQVSFEQVCLLSTPTLHILDILMLIKHENELGMVAKDINVIF